MITVLCDCEMTINSRPLTYVSDDVNDLKPLTPSMFLQEIKDNETPELDIINKIDLNTRLRYRQTLMDQLRKRFRKEYLSQLIMRPSKEESRSLKIGDVVLIGDDNKKRFDWPMARVERIIIGRDSVPRVVYLKTAKGILKRPVQRIFPLEINSAIENDEIVDDCKDLREKIVRKMQVDVVESTKGDKKEDIKKCESNDQVIRNEVKTRSGRIVKNVKPFVPL